MVINHLHLFSLHKYPAKQQILLGEN